MAKFQEVPKGRGLLLQEALDSARKRAPGLTLNRPRAVRTAVASLPRLAARWPGNSVAWQLGARAAAQNSSFRTVSNSEFPRLLPSCML